MTQFVEILPYIICDMKEGEIHLIVSFSSCLLWLASTKESEAVFKTVTLSIHAGFCSHCPSYQGLLQPDNSSSGRWWAPDFRKRNLNPLTSRPPMQLTGALIGFTKIFVLKIVPENIFFESTSIILKEQANEVHKAHVLWNKSPIVGVTSVRINSLKILGFKHHQTATEKICEDRIIRLMPWCKDTFKYFNTASNQNLD